MKQLKEDYERRLETILKELQSCPLDTDRYTRLSTKASCYRTFIAELSKELDSHGKHVDVHNKNLTKEILEQMPDVKMGLDSFYGQQTVLNALNKALNIHNIVGSYTLKEGDKIKLPSGLEAEVTKIKIKVKDDLGGEYYLSAIEVG